MRPRTILYTGKGGVGKTSVAAATARMCARSGLRTVVLSTDPAHSLSDSLEVSLGPEPTAAGDRLWGQEVRAQREMEANWAAVQEWLGKLLADRGIERVRAEELTVPPGMDELFSLLQIKRHHQRGEFDVVIVDCAPTGETLRLLSFPDVMRWWMQRIFPIQRRAMGIAQPLLKRLVDIPLPTEQVYDSVERLFGQLDTLHAMLIDPRMTTIRLVLNPEKMVISEAERTSTYFHLFGYPLDMVVANRILPEEVTDPYFAAWKDTQARYMRRVEEGFSPVPIKKAPLFEDEVVGLEALGRMAAALFGDEDPTRIYYQGRPQVLQALPEGGYRLTIPLPFATRGDVTLRQSGDELFVHVGAHRRHIILPRVLIGTQAARAKLDESSASLAIFFEQTRS